MKEKNNIEHSVEPLIYSSGNRLDMNNLVNAEAIKKCIEYVDTDKQEQFKQLVKSLNVNIKFVDYAPYFEDDGESRNIYRVIISRGGKRISFKYGDSIADTMEGREPELYDIMSIVGADYDFNDSDFEEFCSEFGYDIDSRKAEKTFKLWKKQNEKLHKIFDDSDIEVLPH